MRRMEESVVGENVQRALVEVHARVGGEWGYWGRKGSIGVRSMCAESMRYNCSLRSPSVPPLRKTCGTSSLTLVTSLELTVL